MLVVTLASNVFDGGGSSEIQARLELSCLEAQQRYFSFRAILVAIVSHNSFGPHPQYGWDFPEEIPEKFRKDPGNALRAFPGIPLESTAGIPQTL